MRNEIGKDREGQGKAREKAEDAEKDRDARLRESARHEQRHHWLTGAATLIEIGIALSTVAIITSRRTFWFSAMGLGAVGAALFAFAYLAIFKAPYSVATLGRGQIALLHQHAGGVEDALMLGDLAVLHRPADGDVGA